jgi:hypothetical protein
MIGTKHNNNNQNKNTQHDGEGHADWTRTDRFFQPVTADLDGETLE